MIRLKLFFEAPFLAFFALTHKKEEVWPDETHPMLFAESSCVCMPSFMSVIPFFFLAKVSFLAFLIQKGVWPYRHAD